MFVEIHLILLVLLDVCLFYEYLYFGETMNCLTYIMLSHV
jgi:hypothetical protein